MLILHNKNHLILKYLKKTAKQYLQNDQVVRFIQKIEILIKIEAHHN